MSVRYVGPRTVLEVDLTAQTSRRYDLGDADIADALGGVGLAVLLLERHMAARDLQRVDPLGPDNALVFAAGPFAATPVPAATKHALATLSPLTGLLNEGLSSSYWSGAIRRCGFSAIVVTGTAARWTTLAIDRAGVTFEDAAGLLGKSAREATDALREVRADRTLRVCAIGVAGERGVRFAAVENDGRQAGRGGTGAVMGAKRLKAIALRGQGSIPIADRAATAALAAALKARTLGPKTAKYRVLGTGANMRVLERMGQLPTRNFTASTFAGVESVTPERARESSDEYLEVRSGCAGCPVQCEHMYVRRGGDRKSASASEYESVWAFGPNCGVADLDAVLDAVDRCDRYGLDTISTGSAVAFAMECAEQGLVDRDAFGPPLAFGNAAVLGPAIDAIAARRGLGDVLALGVRAAAERIGEPARAFAMHAKGLELPGYEPRALPTYALGLSVCTRGACHNRAASYDGDLRAPGVTPGEEERVRATIAAEDYAVVWDSLVLCKFVRDCFDNFYAEAAALWTAVTGLALDASALHASAQRTWERKRAINARQGWTRADDTLPPRLFAPLREGPFAGVALDAESLENARARYETNRAALATMREPSVARIERRAMNADALRAVQAPLKDRYRSEPAAAVICLSAEGRLDDPASLSCSVATGTALVKAGLHAATGGDGTLACSGDMLLQALVACAGVTLRAVATSTGIDVRDGVVRAEGDLDFRGTLGIDRDAPVGFKNIRLSFYLDTDASPEQIATLRKLTERYCVIFQTLAAGVAPQTEFRTHAAV